MKFCLGLLKYYKTNLFGSKWTGKVVFLIMTPFTNTDGGVLIIGPASVAEENTLFCPLVRELKSSKIELQIDKELEYNETQKETEFKIAEELNCNAKKVGDNSFVISFKEKGNYVKSDLNIELDLEQSIKLGTKIYKVVGNIDLDIEPEKIGVLQMKLRKKMAFFKGMRRNI